MRGRKKKVVETRDPEISTRDPEIKKRQCIARRYIPASSPVVCPECGGMTRMSDGRHIDPVRKTIVEYRTCARCGIKLAAGRKMVAHEERKHCEFADCVKDYEESLK